MRILGIDPGIGITGYSIVDCDDENYELISCGSIQTDKSARHSSRLNELYDDVLAICEKFKPDCASVEQLFFFKNQKTIIPVSQARGVILLALEKSGVEFNEYTPMVVKQSLTGHGRASKDEVKQMVQMLVELNKSVKLDDTIDSIAIAICHNRNIDITKRELVK